MSDDAKVPDLSDDQVRQIANRCKESFGLPRTRPKNIIRCLQSGRVLTVVEWRKLEYIVCDDHEMGGSDGRTEFDGPTIRIFVRRSVHDLANFGDGRARMTLAHELGHAALHAGVAMHRLIGATGATTLSRLKPTQSAEHQAKVFASAFLIDDDGAAELSSAEKLSEEFGVSLQAAEIAFERLRKQAERAEASKRIDKMVSDFRKSMAIQKGEAVQKFAGEPFPCCAQYQLVPIAAKFRCQNCGAISEQE